MVPLVPVLEGSLITVGFVHFYLLRVYPTEELNDLVSNVTEEERAEEKLTHVLPCSLKTYVAFPRIGEKQESIELFDRIPCEGVFIQFSDDILKPVPIRVVELEDHTQNISDAGIVWNRLVDLSDADAISLRLEQMEHKNTLDFTEECADRFRKALTEEEQEDQQNDSPPKTDEPESEAFEELFYLIDTFKRVIVRKAFSGMFSSFIVGEDASLFRKHNLFEATNGSFVGCEVGWTACGADVGKNEVDVPLRFRYAECDLIFRKFFVGDLFHVLSALSFARLYGQSEGGRLGS